MNKKAQDIVSVILGIIILMIILSSLSNLTGTKYEDEISSLNKRINTLEGDNKALQELLEQCRTESGNKLDDCYSSLANLTTSYENMESTDYYIFKFYNDKLTIYDVLIIYYVELYILIFSFGIGLTITLFRFEIDIRLLNKKNQRKLVRDIKDFLHTHPWTVFLITVVWILLHNAL